MPIEKRFYNYDSNLGDSYLKCFHSDKNTARFVIESQHLIEIVDLDSYELREFITDLEFILKQINNAEDELH